MTQTQKFTGIITRQNKRDVMYLAWETALRGAPTREEILERLRNGE